MIDVLIRKEKKENETAHFRKSFLFLLRVIWSGISVCHNSPEEKIKRNKKKGEHLTLEKNNKNQKRKRTQNP